MMAASICRARAFSREVVVQERARPIGATFAIVAEVGEGTKYRRSRTVGAGGLIGCDVTGCRLERSWTSLFLAPSGPRIWARHRTVSVVESFDGECFAELANSFARDSSSASVL